MMEGWQAREKMGEGEDERGERAREAQVINKPSASGQKNNNQLTME
jgi:hypothetical protein